MAKRGWKIGCLMVVIILLGMLTVGLWLWKGRTLSPSLEDYMG